MKILRISISLNKAGFTTDIVEYDASEKKLIYVLTRCSVDGDTVIRKIPKGELTVLRSHMHHTTNFIEYNTYAFPEDVDTTKDRLTKAIVEVAKNFEQDLNQLLKHIK